jgi:hypothetical protein
MGSWTGNQVAELSSDTGISVFKFWTYAVLPGSDPISLWQKLLESASLLERKVQFKESILFLFLMTLC